MLSSALVRALACPICRAPLSLTSSLTARGLSCPARHHFDLARSGYVHLARAPCAGGPYTDGDTAAMVDARARFLSRDHYEPLVQHLLARVREDLPRSREGYVLEVGAGPAHYLSRIVSAVPGTWGLALDLSRAAARRAARAHPRIGSIVADRRDLPIRDRAIDAALSIFAPRAPGELARVLGPRAPCIVVIPSPRHLAELRTPGGLLGIEPDKRARLLRTFSPWFELRDASALAIPLQLAAPDVADLIAMGPTAFHASRLAAAQVPLEPVAVTAVFEVIRFARRAS